MPTELRQHSLYSFLFFFRPASADNYIFFFSSLGQNAEIWKKQRVLSACWTASHLFGIVSSQLQKRGAKTAEFPAEGESDWRRRRRWEKLKDGNKYICSELNYADWHHGGPFLFFLTRDIMPETMALLRQEATPVSGALHINLFISRRIYTGGDATAARQENTFP